MRLIDADALKKAVNDKRVVGRFNTIMLIDEAPTLPNPCGNPCNFTRPTGEWICTFHSTFPQYEPSEYRCSKCNGRGNESDKFCKHCGAKMEVNNNG